MTGGVEEMKNKKNSVSGDGIFKSKGFYVALYSCMGVLLVGSIVVSYNMMNAPQNQEVVQVSNLEQDSVPTMSQAIGSHSLAEVETRISQSQETAISGITDFFRNNDVETEEAPAEEAAPEATQAPQTGAPAPQPQPTVSESEAEVVKDNSGESEEVVIEEIEADPVFNVFSDNDQMLWPVSGEILMEYSTDSMVFDETLNQFRRNDTVNIASYAGSQVRAAADGVVTSVSSTRRDGNTVTIEHGNGWATTYSQLQDGIFVSEGDVVIAGEIIGEVGSPSVFTSGLGYNLGFRVARDEGTVNPLTVLE